MEVLEDDFQFSCKKEVIFQVPLVFGSVNKLVPVHSFSNGYPSILVLDSTLDDSW